MNPQSAPIAVVLGTRPEIIKLAPVVRELGPRAWVIHTGQHYDPELSDTCYTGAGLDVPATLLDGVGGASRSRQIAAILHQLDALFDARRPAAVIVQGDTNSTSAGAQAASYHGVPLVHVEAGLRSHDRAMPEELNRMVVGVLADLHCAATEHNLRNLRAEGVPIDRIVLTGNTIVQATEEILHQTSPGQPPVQRQEGPVVLATIHRPENTDDPVRLAAILRALGGLGVPVMLPLHPRTAGRIRQHDLGHLLAGITTVGPLGHAEFLHRAAAARLLISDSGGVQEECTVLKKPLIVVRNSTERPEAIDTGFAHLVQPGPRIGELARLLLADTALPGRLRRIPSPYGDRNAAARIVAATRRLLGEVRVAPVTRMVPVATG
jgi:UDP-N-acetylglucosamine 2-epimerase (non-hydrolysing)